MALKEDMEIISELIRQCIAENSIMAQNQTAFMEKYERLTNRYEKMKQQYESLEQECRRRKEQYDRITAFSKILTEQAELPMDFSDDLWLAAVDHATVNANETVTFAFKDGTEITEQM